MLEKYLLRSPTLEHALPVFQLMIRCDLRDVGFADTDLEDLKHDWGSIILQKDAWLAIDAHGNLRGYAACLPWGEGVRMVIHDDPGTENTDLFAGLLLFCEKRAAAQIHKMNDPHKRGIYTHLSDRASFQKQIVEKAGYSIKKYVFNMHRDLDGNLPEPELPKGVHLRTTVTGQDERAIHALVQEAFDWRERIPQPFEQWKAAIMRPEIYNENLWFLAVQNNEIIGTCLCFKYSSMGWIRQLAVKKPFRKLGIGRALLQYSFLVFKNLGIKKVGLAVESVNINAVHFYETAGMYKAVHLNEYMKEI
jgi:mycothiol synthase